MKRFIDLWSGKDIKEVTVYWTCRNGQYMSAIKQDDGFNTVCSDSNCADMKSKTTSLLKQLSSNTKLIWKKA